MAHRRESYGSQNRRRGAQYKGVEIRKKGHIFAYINCQRDRPLKYVDSFMLAGSVDGTGYTYIYYLDIYVGQLHVKKHYGHITKISIFSEKRKKPSKPVAMWHAW